MAGWASRADVAAAAAAALGPFCLSVCLFVG